MKKYFKIFFTIFSILNATEVFVGGNAFLENQQDHSSIKVKLTAVSPSAVTDSTTTAADGSYLLDVEVGIYNCEFSKTGYISYSIPNYYFSSDTTLPDVTLQYGTVQEISGTISGTLTNDYVYDVVGDLTVQDTSTLTIDAGVHLRFVGDYDLICNGSLTAVGTESDSIVFTSGLSSVAAGDWGHVYLNYSDDDSNTTDNQISYCVFEYGEGENAQLYVNNTSVLINNSSFRNSGRGDVFLHWSEGAIKNSQFSGGSNNYYNINNHHSKFVYRNNTISNFDYGFRVDYSNSEVEIKNMNFLNGYGHALYFNDYAKGIIDSCNFENIENDWTVYIHHRCLVDFTNNRLENINSGNVFRSYHSHTDVINNYIEGRLYFDNYNENDHNQSSPPQIAYNTIVRSPDDCCYEGLQLQYNNRLVETHHNTIIGFTSGYRGIYLYDNDSLAVHSNIVYGNSYGIYSNNNGYMDLSYNNFYANINLIQDDDFPQGFGDAITSNTNGDPADIYSNIFMDPQFADFEDYELLATSPAVNAGSPDYTDADGTVSDIGANSFYFPFLITHTPLTNTNDTDGPYSINATIVPTQQQSITPTMYYKLIEDGFFENDAVNYSLEFNGNGGGAGVQIPDHTNYTFNQTITVEAWIKPASNGRGYILSNRGYNGNEGYLLEYDDWDRRVRWSIWTNYNNSSWDGDTQLIAGQWYHVAATFDGSRAKLYINGILDGNWDWQPQGIVNQPNDGITIGSRRDYGSEFDGLIDEVRIWNIARSGGEVNTNMNRELFGNESGLIGYWRFNEGSGDNVLDYSNSSNDGTIISASYQEESPSLLPVVDFDLTDWNSVTMSLSTGNDYTAEIPGQALNTIIDYFLEVTDGTDTLMSPYDVPYSFHTFNVSMFETLIDLNAISNNDGSITLSWGTPVPISGSLQGYNLYYDTSPNVEISTENQISSFILGENSYTHENLEEGINYYYKITGIFDDGTSIEIQIADETSGISDNSTIVVAEGIIQIEDATDHSGVKITFYPETASGEEDSVFTDSTGAFRIVLPVAIYSVDITKNGCVPQHLSSLLFSGNYNFGTIHLIARSVQELSGSISDTLMSDLYYIVTGNLSISNNDTLWIEPGAIIAFDGYHRIVAQGPIYAIGTEEDSISFISHSSQPGPGDWEYIQLQSNASGSKFDYCVFENGDGYSEWVGSGVIRVDHVSNVHFDHSRFSHNQRGAIAFYGSYSNFSVQNSTFSFNYDDQSQDGGVINIRLSSSGGDVLISGNEFYQNYGDDIASYECIGLTITDNIFYSDHNNFDNQAMYMRYVKPLIISNNTLTGRSYIRVNHDCFGIIEKNMIQHNTNYTYGIYVSQSNMEITSNVISNCRDGVYYESNRNFSENDTYQHLINYNTIYNTFEASLELRNNSQDIEISNNTLVNADKDNNNGSDGAAVYFYNNSSDFFTHSNVVTNSRYGGYFDNNSGSFEFYNNNFWNNENLFSGSGYPTDLGTVTSQNINGDPSDIYSNIYLDPEFVEPDSNDYSLLSTSPLIDAGYILFVDPDGTIRDIGAHYFDHGNPHNLILEDVDDQEVTLHWSTVNRDSLTGYNVYSKLTTETDYTLSVSTTDTTAIVSNLTNNIDYNFVATSVYPNSESINSISVTGRPGLAEIAFSPTLLIQSTSSVDTSVFNYQILNNGVKDLTYSLEEDSLEQFLTGYYYNNNNWDDFSELLAVRADDEINFNWDDVSQLPPGVPNENFHIRWMGTVNFPATGDYYFEYCSDDGFRMSIDDNWIIWSGGCCWCSQNQFFEEGTHEIIIDYYANSNPNYTYLKWQPPGENLDWFGGSGLLSVDMFSNTSGTVAPSSSIDINIAIPPINTGAFTSIVPYSSNDKSDPYVEIPLLLMSDYVFIPSTQFLPAEETGDPFYLVISDGNIDGDELQTGDEIAIFDGDSCVGAGMFSGGFPFVVKAYGFVNGNSYQLKAWDNSQYREATVQVDEYSVGNGTFVVNGFDKVTLNATVYASNQIAITENQFNLVSLNTYPQDPDASSVFGDIEGLKIVYDDHGGAFIPDYNINTIGSVNLTEGYYLFFDSSNTQFNYSGLGIDVENWSLNIQAHRWNYISYLPETAADTSIFSSIHDSIDIIVSDDGGSWIPSLNVNTIGNFEPGSGYKIFLSGTSDLNFTYFSSSRAPAKILAHTVKETNRFKYTQTGLPYTIVIQSADFEGRSLQTGDEIGVFYEELCVGAAVFNGNWPLVITAWEGNEDTELQGFKENSEINLKLFSEKYRTDYPLFNEFRSEQESIFYGANYSVVKHASTGGNVLPDSYALGNNYPNPFNPTTVIPYQLPEDTRVRITVYNMLGQEVAVLVDEFQLANFHRISWKGKDTRGKSVPSGVYIYRLETPSYQKSHKLLLLK